LEKRELRAGDYVVVGVNPIKINRRLSGGAFQRTMAKRHGGKTGVITDINHLYSEADCRVAFEDGSYGFFYKENLELDPRYLTKLGSLL
jgi:hypothetical protein